MRFSVKQASSVEVFQTHVGAPLVGARNVIARLTLRPIYNASGTHKGSPYIGTTLFNSQSRMERV